MSAAVKKLVAIFIIYGLVSSSSIKFKQRSSIKVKFVNSILNSLVGQNIALFSQSKIRFMNQNPMMAGSIINSKMMKKVCHITQRENTRFTYILVSSYKSGHKYIQKGIQTIRKCDLFQPIISIYNPYQNIPHMFQGKGIYNIYPMTPYKVNKIKGNKSTGQKENGYTIFEICQYCSMGLDKSVY